MSILFLAPGPLKWASTRLRAVWPAAYIPDAGWQEQKGAIRDADVYIFVKKFDKGVVQQMLEAGKRVFWDICDPVHWFSPAEARWMADIALGVIASNQGLANDFNKWYRQRKATCIPDRLELAQYPIQKQHGRADIVRFIWYGAGQNRIGIFGALAYLERLVAEGVKIELTIMDDGSQTWQFTDAFPVYYVPWSLEQENQIIAAHDIAIVPPYPGPWGKVKSSNKILTAWACGLPACDCQNYDELYALATSAERRGSDAVEGYSWLVRGFDVKQSAHQWGRVLDV